MVTVKKVFSVTFCLWITFFDPEFVTFNPEFVTFNPEFVTFRFR